MLRAHRTIARLLAAAVAAVTAASVGILAPARPASAAAFVPISGAGSTWSSTAMQEWINNVTAFGMTVNYAAVGSTTGRADFAQGTVDFAASDIPYGLQDGANNDLPPARGFAYIPDTAGAVTFPYNLHIGGQQVTNLRLSGAVIAGIFTNQITMWNDPKITADNPGLKLPAEPIVPVVRSDGSGATYVLTQWMSATQGSSWTAYCQVTGRSPCTPTSAYPVQPGTSMIGLPGDIGVSGYVSQPQAEGAIGYVQYSFAKQTHLPVANVLNAAGYYTEPTPGHIGVSLLDARINMDSSNPATYLTQDLSQVYTDPDPRTYELSYYSYMIVPTDTSFGLTSDKGYTLGAFGEYLLCQGQKDVDTLGYSALPINLVEAGFAQLQRIPGNQVPTQTAAQLQQCPNPTFAPDGTNLLASNDPNPPACDKQGPAQCAATSAVSGSEPLTVTVPQSGTGSFTLTVPGATVSLTVSGTSAVGTLNQITVADTRSNSPGWSVTGQAADFMGTAAGSTISGNQLGWAPNMPSTCTGVTAGGQVPPGSPGLGTTAAVLASAAAGSSGTCMLGAGLTLNITSATPGTYSSSLTLTAVTALP